MLSVSADYIRIGKSTKHSQELSYDQDITTYMPNNYPYHNINQPFNLTVTIIEWHKYVTALSTHTHIKMNNQNYCTHSI